MGMTTINRFDLLPGTFHKFPLPFAYTPTESEQNKPTSSYKGKKKQETIKGDIDQV